MRNILRLLSLVFSPRNIVSVGAYLCGLPFSLLGRLVPKKNIIVFGARNGKAYDWNSRYLYEYAVERNDPSFQCYWVTRSSDVYDFLSNQGRPVLRRFSWRGFVTMLQAQYAVISSSITDIDSNLLSGAIVIQTGHGLPVKKIGYGFLNHFSEGGFFQVLMYKLSCLATRIFDRQCRFDYVVSPSDEFVCRLIEDYRIDRDKIWITGMPRDDLFFQERPACEEKGRVLSFLPTHRYHLAGCSNQLKDLFGYGFDADRLQRLLEKLDCTFYLKFHHLHEGTEDIFRLFENHSRLKIYEGEDAMTLLLDTDVLISDYSSIFCNFLHLNRPVVFSLFDYDPYKKAQCISNLLDNPPGPVCMNWDEVESAIQEALESDKYSEERLAMRKRIYKFNDGRNCERIYERICSLESFRSGDFGGVE